MSGWDSYRAVYGAELRAAAREFDDHGWPVVEETASTLLLITGTALDVLEVSTEVGKRMCAALRGAGAVVPVAATPLGSWWYAMSPGSSLPAELRDAEGVRLRTAGAVVLAPPSAVPDGWVHWRVSPALTGYRVPDADLILGAAVDSVRLRDRRPGAKRPQERVAIALR
jgi:bifunctional DNA primase/polymerase-like protein